MTEFPRLLRSGSPTQRALLNAAQLDAPSAASQELLLLSLGVGGAVVSIAGSAQAASNLGTASSPSASASLLPLGEAAASTGVPSMAAPVATAIAVPATSISTALVAKWLLVSVLSFTAIGVGVVVGRGIARNTPPWQAAGLYGNSVGAHQALRSRQVSREASPAVIRTDSAMPTAPTLPLPPPDKDLGTSEVPATNHSLLARSSANRPVANELLTVSGETALVEKARDALRHGDPAGCLALLEIRRKGVRGGVLAPEATVLRIDALRALGQRARASQEAARFVHDYPDSPLVERIRGLLGPAEP